MRKRRYVTHIPPADGQPGLELGWPADCQSAMDDALQRAEHWLAQANKPILWTAMIIGRQEQDGATRRTAYEVAFLTRLQQRLEELERAARERQASRDRRSRLQGVILPPV
ncbi:LasR-specific antiactivator QslA [Pseudomonas sp. CAN2814]|uniref:LasR-specific antiactivator QslA n=1 Tax=Pseudomonas sp. CAN1 TaxID=3046726 RepID=UPI00264817D1|nr:LasR-specific antiactivator QslA [Pseudomonas sp. CAN1]MDN6859916.1 LasR-specific antiactivator QslA [Pseudomonas sp. CAN1]